MIVTTEEDPDLINGHAVALIRVYRANLIPGEPQRRFTSGWHDGQCDAGIIAVNFEMLPSTPFLHSRPQRPKPTRNIHDSILSNSGEQVKLRNKGC
jgi:hypothetical protein